MNYLLAKLTEGAHVIAVEDRQSWEVISYTNCYVLQRQEQVILIDAGLLQYREAMSAALAKLGLVPEQVTQVLLTHGHQDHAAGAVLCKNARKFVHAADRSLLTAGLAAQFTDYTPLGTAALAADGVAELEITLVNTHSPGSVAIFDRLSQALFVGDFFCYFGEILPDGLLVTDSETIKQGSCRYVAGQAAAQAPDFDKFMLGLERLLPYPAEFFCTGHGVVLRRDIQAFLRQMWQSGRQANF